MASKYEIWASSHPVDGEYFNASFMGSQTAVSFTAAVEQHTKTVSAEDLSNWSYCFITDRWFYHGLEVFETEELAQQSKWQQLEREMKGKS